jgi:hypothetical protein
MLTTLKSAVIAGLIGLASLAAVPAKADSLYLGFGDRHDDARFGVYLGDSSRMHYPRERWREARRWDYQNDWRARRCSPEKAAYKASAIGLHRVRVQYVSRDSIGVAGFRHGDWVEVTFAMAPGCPIISY